MDLEDQLKALFPDHKIVDDGNSEKPDHNIWLQEAPLICKYEKRNGKPITLIEGYNGAKSDFKSLCRHLQSSLSVGGSIKNDRIIIQGNNRDRIMDLLQGLGFQVKRVGG